MGNRLVSNLLTLLTFLVSFQGSAADLEPATIKKKIIEKSTFKKWSNIVTAEYTPEISGFESSNMFYVGDFNYRTSPRNRFRWFQRVIHQIIPESGKENSGETIGLNPRLQYFYYFKEPEDKSYQFGLRFGTELGTSPDSREDGVKAIPNVRFEFDKRFGFMTISLRPYVSYWITEYSTGRTGNPLPMFTLGHNLNVLVNFTKKFSWNLELDTGFQMFQPADVKDAQSFNSNPNAAPLETSKTALYVATDFGYQLNKSFLMRIGYYQFDKFVSDGKYDLELLNNKTTRFFVGLDFSF
ncbi:MAG: hypothetical protein A4S09_09985 [Proteobacteria bacterium SG_bin7]|nr:MAG: hypothetical protein A4S09_09985 [Proteobacteria bacterium SG_bin7]